MMTRHLLSLVAALVVAAAGAQPAAAFVEDRAPTLANGGVDPNRTGDPAAVAAAQRALEAFFAYTNRTYSIKGYANAWLMREELGNRQTDWLDKTLPLACGRLVSGWKNQNWIPGRGWRHEAPPPGVVRGAPVPCEFEAPTLANSGADPRNTYDPATVAAAQRALTNFFRETNQNYSQAGYSNPWTMREELGNEQTAWLDQTLPLAEGHLLGGWKNRNWIPSRGWQHEAPPTASLPFGALLGGGPVGTTLAWIADRVAAPMLPPELAAAPRAPTGGAYDPEAAHIMDSLGVDLGGEAVP
jgi:hypothetical protein